MPKRSEPVKDFEKLGVFYLGRPFDQVRQKAKPGWLLYDSKDLVTHAVCVGMTGSGKTGLCIGLLEEAAIDGIPALAIDPKGDLGNLLLTFPDLRAKDFRPWINEDDARRKRMSPEQYAAAQASLWKEGLEDWGQDRERIKRLKATAEFVIYTPGSSAGFPVSVLRAFSPPPSQILQDPELLHEHINATATSLMGLIGVSADPVKSPPHILLSAILKTAWREGRSLDLVTLIEQIHTPPFRNLGALEVESFYPSKGRGDDPAKNRFALAKRLNNLIAAPSFQVWMQGQPLDVGQLLYRADGKPRVSILSIAHLNDAERMFFVTLLLGQTVAWMRQQTGTTSLRAILYMDEIFGYLPPIANPPSKQPLLTLLKQARAFGLGVVLATQNPIDLDYKALSNTGTWFLGRLQTERDKARVLEGLKGAGGEGPHFDRQQMERTLTGLRQRVFLLHNVHEDAPALFETRWTMSYLRGPLTRDQIRTLMEGREGSESAETPKQGHTEATHVTSARPILQPGIPQVFVPLRAAGRSGDTVVYHPMLLGSGVVHFTDPGSSLEVTNEGSYLTALPESSLALNWDDSTKLNITLAALQSSPREASQYEPLPASAGDPKSYERWKKDFASWLGRTQRLEIWRSPNLEEQSRSGESERDFRIRLQQLAHERRDSTSARLREKYAPKLRAIQERIRRAEQAKAREVEQAKQQYVQTAISVGSALLGAFLGRKTISSTTIGRTASAARGAGRSIKETKDVARAEENLDSLRKQLAEVESQFERELSATLQKIDPATESLERVSVRPTKGNVQVKLLALAWVPSWLDETGVKTAAS